MQTNCYIYIFALHCVLGVSFEDFHFTYRPLRHNLLELQTIYTGYQIELISFDDTDNFKPVSDYHSNRSNHIIIPRLVPCITYQLSVIVYNVQSNVEFIHSENISLIDTELSLNVQNVVADSNSIFIEMNISRIHCIYNLNVIRDNLWHQLYTKDNITNQLIIPKLEPCTHYHIRIEYNQQANSSQYLVYDRYIKTAQEILQPAQNLKFDPDTNLFTWGPMTSVNCPIKYVIIIKSFKTLNQNTVFTGESMLHKYDFGFLPKCLQFVIVIHPEGREDLRQDTHIVTPYQEPGPITNITVDVAYENMVTIKWYRPERNPECIKHFVVKVNDKSFATTNALEHSIHEIQPFKISNISVCLITQHSTEICTRHAFITSQRQTKEIKNVTIINVAFDDATKLTVITWIEPNEAIKSIKNYKVMLVDGSKHVIHRIVTRSNRIEIPDLIPCQSYILQIETIPTIQWTNMIESTFELLIKAQKPLQPAAPTLLSKTNNSLTMQSRYSHDLCTIEVFRFTCTWANDERFVDDESGNGTMANLKSRTAYNCSVKVKNEMGWSESSTVSKFFTGDVLVRFDLYAESITSNSIDVSWNSHYRLVKLNVTKIKNMQTVPLCKYGKYRVTLTVARKKSKLNNLEPFTNYSIRAVAMGLKQNYTRQIFVTTFPDVPHQVRDLRVANSTSHAVTISWKLPCTLNGRVKGFVIKTLEPDSKSFLPFDKRTNRVYYYYTVNQIRTADRQHSKISVAVKLYNWIGPLNESTISAIAPISDWLDDWVEISMADSRHALLNIKNDMFMLGNGSVTGLTLVISDRECNNLETDDVFSLLKSKNDCIHQCHFSVIPNTVKIRLNEEISQVCSNPSEIELKKGPDYAILARIITAQGYTDTFPIVFRSNQIVQNSSNFVMIFLIVQVTFVFIIMTATTIVWYYKNRSPQKIRQEKVNYIEVQFFPDFYKLIDQSFIANEYKSINDMSLSSLKKSVAQKYPEKNLYKDIVPYDYNRVVLVPTQYCPTDYINASYIDGEKQRAQYIAAQAPKEETVYDFWHMILETGCDQIVMLTLLPEKETAKCYNYYPEKDEVLEFNDIIVKNANETSHSTFMRRELHIKRGQTKRLVCQYQFLEGPDRECPRNEISIIEFIEFIENDRSKSNNPLVVHCSAGTGRTGTFIALDILLQSFRNDKFISIFDTVRKLRVQRWGMVQTVAQYEFLYDVVNVYFHRRMYK